MRRTALATAPLLGVLALSACGQADPPKRAAPTTEVNSNVVGGNPVGIAASGTGDVWVVLPNGEKVVRVGAGDDPSTAEVPVPGTPLRVAIAEDGAAAWVTAFGEGTVVRVDTAGMQVTDHVPVGAGAEGVTEAFGDVWVAVQDDGLLVQVDPVRRKVVHKVDVGQGVRLVVAGPDALWLDDHLTGTVVRVDPTTYEVRRSDPVCDGPEDMVVAGTTVWLTCSVSEELVAVGADDLAVSQRVPLDGTPDAITTAPDGSLLVVLQDGPTLVRLDSATGAETSRTRLGTQKQLFDRANLDLVVTGDDAWITSFADGRVLRTPWQG